MVHYIEPALLVETCGPEGKSPNLGAMLVQVIATVLDNEVLFLIFLYLLITSSKIIKSDYKAIFFKSLHLGNCWILHHYVVI